MPSKINVVQLMNRGISAASVAEVTARESSASSKTLQPGESDAAVMKVAKRIAIVRDPRLRLVAQAVRASRNPAEFAAAMIQGRYTALGGSRSFLGAPTTRVTVCPDRVGYFRHFKGGSIYFHPRTGAHEVHGAIRAKWAGMGWERSFLGYPRTDETKGNDTEQRGRYNHFQGGSIYWHPSTGAHEVHGAIRVKYLELGAEASFLGYPKTDETGTPDRIGRFNHFQAGSIYWTPHTWAHEVHGLIRGYWAQHGWERNPQLGYPITDELIPNRGIGHTRAPTIRKPIKAIPLDVVRLPDEQPSPTIAASLSALHVSPPVMTAVAAKPALRTTFVKAAALKTATAPAVSSPRPASSAVHLAQVSPAILQAAALRAPHSFNPVANHKGQSQDRYSDFEDGVVFWQRGSKEAGLLAPRSKAPNGAKMAWTGQEVAAIATPHIRQALGALPGANVVGVNYAGTTPYSFDGAGMHNRAHKLRVILQGMRQAGFIPVPAISTVEIQAEINFDPVDREIVGYLTGWKIASTQGNFLGGGSLSRDLAVRLDPSLWRQFHITNVPGTAADPIAVLSVKTQADGDVVVYFEP